MSKRSQKDTECPYKTKSTILTPLPLGPKKRIHSKKRFTLEKTHLQIFELATGTPTNRLAFCIFTMGSSYLNNANAAHAYLVDECLISTHWSDFAGPLCGIKYTLYFHI